MCLVWDTVWHISSFSLYFQDITDDPLSAHLKADKVIVFLSCLMNLFAICQHSGCGSAIDPTNRGVVEHGAVMVVHYTCNSNHCGQWSSSPAVGQGKGRVWVLNTVLAAYSLTCGLHISQVRDFGPTRRKEGIFKYHTTHHMCQYNIELFSSTSGLVQK